MAWVKRSGLFLLFVALFSGAQWFCHRQTDGFTVGNISSDLTFHPEWEVAPLSPVEEVRALLSQRFTYLAKGAQAYVFASEDGRYVLKFFRFNHMRPPLRLNGLEPYYKKRCAKLGKDFASYRLAYEHLREETGVVMLHLNKTDHLRQKVRIVDRLGIVHELEADRMEFILQRRAELIYPQLERWMEGGRVEEAKEGLSRLVGLLKKRLDLGLFDKDPDLNTNFGFIGTDAVQIDVGRFKLGEVDSEVIWRITENLKQYLDVRYPVLSTHLQEEIKR